MKKRQNVNLTDWVEEAQHIFNYPKPGHFTDYGHCCECFEHDEVLRESDVDSIGWRELGNAAWDPMIFASVEGTLYYLPALIRLTANGLDNPREDYLEQFLERLIHNGQDNVLVKSCSREQRIFITDFLEYLIENYPEQVSEFFSATADILKAREIWRAD